MKSEIDQALQAHAAWRKRFRDFLNGKAAFDTALAGLTDCCDFGEWLKNEGYRLIPEELHLEICEAHAAFHRVAAEIVQKIKDRRFAEARADIAADGILNQSSEQLAALLRKASLRKPGAAAAAPAEAAEAATPETPAATSPEG